MQKSRLIEVLHTFNKKEFRELKKWFLSPAHNQRQDVIDLYDYLLKKDHLYNEEALKKEIVYQAIYPNQSFDDAKMRQVIHFTFKALESFLAYTSFLEKGSNQELNLIREYRRRGIKRSFEKTSKTMLNAQNNPIYQDDYFLYEKYILQLEQYKFHTKSAKRVGTFNLQEISDIFDYYFIASKLKQACWMMSHQVVYKTDYQNVFLKDILAYIDQKKELLNIPSISTYYFIYKTLSEPDNEFFFIKLKQELDVNKSVLPLEEMKSVFLFALNYCTKKINSGKSKFIKEAWDILKKGIEENILIEDGILSHFIYVNFIVIGIKLEYYEEVEEYIFKYGNLLDEQYKENYIKYNLAKLFFAKGNYERAMELVNQYEFKDILVNLNAKIMLLKMYYELSEYKALESLLESMRAYLQRKKELGNRTNGYKNIVRYTKKLLKVNPYNKAQIAKLRLEIEEASPLTEKAWLLKQLDAL